MDAFWKAVKKLVLPPGSVLNAVCDLTRTDRREASLPRYELSGPARKACFQFLGPPPEHELYGRMVEGPPLYSEEEQREWRQCVEEQRTQEEAQAEPQKARKPRQRGQ